MNIKLDRLVGGKMKKQKKIRLTQRDKYRQMFLTKEEQEILRCLNY
jgi:hypothetical protein